MTRPDVVIVSHNSQADLERTLPQLGADVGRITVVDNASRDGTPAFVRDRFPAIEVVELADNVGYGAACNVGISRSGSPLVLLLNPDAWPVGDAVARLAECVERHPRLAAAAPELRSPDGRRQPSFVPFPTRWWLGQPAISAHRARVPKVRTGRRGFLIGAALLVRRDAVQQVGGFDESFFMFYEEVDLCRRLQEAGWQIGTFDAAAFIHVGGTSTRRNWPAMYREQLLAHLRFVAKHEGVGAAEHSRKLLVRATRIRAMLASAPEAGALRATADWLAGADARTLIETHPRGYLARP